MDNKIIAILAVVVVVIAGAGAAVFLMNNNQTEEKKGLYLLDAKVLEIDMERKKGNGRRSQTKGRK